MKTIISLSSIIFLSLFSNAGQCPSCKYNNSKEDRFCLNCAAKIRDSTEDDKKEMERKINQIQENKLKKILINSNSLQPQRKIVDALLQGFNSNQIIKCYEANGYSDIAKSFTEDIQFKSEIKNLYDSILYEPIHRQKNIKLKYEINKNFEARLVCVGMTRWHVWELWGKPSDIQINDTNEVWYYKEDKIRYATQSIRNDVAVACRDRQGNVGVGVGSGYNYTEIPVKTGENLKALVVFDKKDKDNPTVIEYKVFN